MTVFFIGVGMSVCLHRYFSHTAFVPTSRVFTFFLAVLSTFAYQNGQSRGNRCGHARTGACMEAPESFGIISVRKCEPLLLLGLNLSPTPSLISGPLPDPAHSTLTLMSGHLSAESAFHTSTLTHLHCSQVPSVSVGRQALQADAFFNTCIPHFLFHT